jgi:NAD(P)-dependent dehydrogenase (short-subunit alcohol dehydrogenase family)
MAEVLAAQGGSLILAGRSEERTRPVLADIRSRSPGSDASFLELDVSDLGSVRRAALDFLASGRKLDVLVNNAGIAGTFGLSPEGFDLTYATNHIGPFLLTQLLLPRLEESEQGRVVNVASIAHKSSKGFDWSVLEPRAAPKKSGFPEYADTKLMNILHAKELARRLAMTNITTYALHPGGVASNIWRSLPKPLVWFMKLFMISNEEGAKTQIYCATAPELATVSGRYYVKSQETRPTAMAEDAALARELWIRSEAAVSRRT